MHFSALDLLGVFFYLSIVLGCGLYAKGKQNSVRDFYLASRSLPWYFILFSIVATETSSLTFLSVPGISFSTHIAFLQMAFGFILGRFFVAYFILPLYANGSYASIYQWVGEHFGEPTQKSVSAVFLITRILADGIRLFVTSIPIALILGQVFTDSLSQSEVGILTLLAIAIFTIIYTVIGGFRSVVITDSIQFWIYLLGGIFAFSFLLYQLTQNQSISQLLEKAHSAGKFSFYQGFQGNFWQTPYYFINAVWGGAFITIGSHGIDQLIAQRALACRTLAESRKAIIASGFLVFVQFTLFLAIGILLYLHYPDSKIAKDQVFSRYILENIPAPFAGFLVAAILASAMSTLSSSINSLSLSTQVDLKLSSKQNQIKSSKLWSCFWGMVLFLSSLIPYFLSSNSKDSLVELGLKISSFTFGPMLALFCLLVLYKKYNFYVPAKVLPLSLLTTLVSCITSTYYLQPAFTFVIPLGFCLFFLIFFLFRQIHQLTRRSN
ncbi:MAG: sodium:solute symporter [Spirochaetota bacterium]